MNRNLAIGKLLCIVMVLVVITTPEISRATEQFETVSSHAANFLNFPRGTRSISMGRCGAADPSAPMNTYYNPAVAFLIEGIHAVQGYNEWPGDIDFQDYGAYAGRSFALGSNSKLLYGGGIRYTHLRVDAQERVIFLPEGTGRSYNSKDYYLTLTAAGGIATQWVDAGIGLSAKPTNVADEWVWAYDAGFLALGKLPMAAGVRIVPAAGVSFLNLNKDVDFRDGMIRLPDEIRLGAGLRFESPASEAFEKHLGARGPVAALSFIYEHTDPNNGKDRNSYGAELTFLDAFSMRVGHSDQSISSDTTTYGMGFGWWFHAVRVQFDVASFPTAWLFNDTRENSYGVSIIADL